jgi:hypothetical protein
VPQSSLLAVLDACVLVPAALCDLLLRAGSAGLYQLRWSDEILAEVQRTLVGDLARSSAQAQRRITAMSTAFPDALVNTHQGLVTSMPAEVSAKDRHVAAAAVAAGAAVIVTSNLRDFPKAALQPLGIEPQSPDDFLLNLYALDEDALKGVIIKQAAALRAPALRPLEILKALHREVPDFAARMAQAFQP